VKSFAILVCALTPALLILGYGVAKARGSWTNEALWNAVMLGASSALAALVVEVALQHLVPAALPPLISAGITALLVVALPEEVAKFFALVTVAGRDVDARRQQDVLIQALGVALGFAALENLFYLAAPGDWLPVAGGRALTARPRPRMDGPWSWAPWSSGHASIPAPRGAG
jgi:RsiW-degrading membrane proteinase PrsW (M82 family)